MAKCSGVVRRVGAAALTALLVSCGGGTSQIDEFKPTSVIAFGDELSMLLPDGRKYAINQLDEDGVRDCAVLPMWVQYVASGYGLVFPQCNPDNLPTTSEIRATVGATVADFENQVQAYIDDGGTFDRTKLVTVMVGMNDVLELYSRYPTESRESLIEQARDRGEALAERMNTIAEAGGRILVSNAPDMGLSPFATAEKAANDDIDRAAFLSELSTALNVRMSARIIADGRSFGIIFADDLVRAGVKAPSSLGMVNATTPLCTVALPDCTTDTLIEAGEDESEPTASTYLWADDTRLSNGFHVQLGSNALNRIENLPF
jgi:outer membrane lipase/esterase